MKTENPKVLVACPTYEGMDYCIEKFLTSIKELDYPDYQILIVDNSTSDNYFEKLSLKPGINLIRDKSTEKDSMKKVVSSRNKILKYAIEKGYDFILMMDPDVIPPKNIIQKLLESKKEIISGLYLNYFESSGKLKILPVVWASITESEFEEIKNKIKLPDFVTSSFDLRRHLTEEEVNSETVLEVALPSAGCVLLSRNVFEKIKYNLLDLKKIGFKDTSVKTSDDIGFFIDARKAGFKCYCDTSVKCDHLVGEKYIRDKDGNLVHKGFA